MNIHISFFQFFFVLNFFLLKVFVFLVQIGNCLYDERDISLGVPQGSVLIIFVFMLQ